MDGPALRLTVPVVFSVVVDCDEDAPDSDRKSDLMKPSVPFCLTLDQPFDWLSNTSTLVFAASVLSMLVSVDEPDLMFTTLVVLSVPIAAPPDDAGVAVLPFPRVKKSDLI